MTSVWPRPVASHEALDIIHSEFRDLDPFFCSLQIELAAPHSHASIQRGITFARDTLESIELCRWIYAASYCPSTRELYLLGRIEVREALKQLTGGGECDAVTLKFAQFSPVHFTEVPAGNVGRAKSCRGIELVATAAAAAAAVPAEVALMSDAPGSSAHAETSKLRNSGKRRRGVVYDDESSTEDVFSRRSLPLNDPRMDRVGIPLGIAQKHMLPRAVTSNSVSSTMGTSGNADEPPESAVDAGDEPWLAAFLQHIPEVSGEVSAQSDAPSPQQTSAVSTTPSSESTEDIPEHKAPGDTPSSPHTPLLTTLVTVDLHSVATNYGGRWSAYEQRTREGIDRAQPDRPARGCHRETLFHAEFFSGAAYARPQNHALRYARDHALEFTVVHTRRPARPTPEFTEERFYGSFKDTDAFLKAYEEIPEKQRCMYQVLRFDHCWPFFADIEKGKLEEFDEGHWNSVILPRTQQYFYGALLGLYDDESDLYARVNESLHSRDNQGLAHAEAHRPAESKDDMPRGPASAASKQVTPTSTPAQHLWKPSSHANQNDILFEPLALRLFMLCIFYNYPPLLADTEFWYIKHGESGSHVSCILDPTVYTGNRPFRLPYSAKVDCKHTPADRLKPLGFKSGQLQNASDAERLAFRRCIVQTRSRASISDPEHEFLIPLITVDRVLRKCQRMGMYPVLRTPKLSSTLSGLLQSSEDKGPVTKGKRTREDVRLVLRSTAAEIVAPTKLLPYHGAKPAHVSEQLRRSVVPERHPINTVAFFTTPEPGRWQVADVESLLLACYTCDAATRGSYCYLNEMRTPVCAFMLDIDFETSEGFLDLFELQPALGNKNLFGLITEFVAEVYPEEGKAILIMEAHGIKRKSQGEGVTLATQASTRRSSYTMVFYKLILDLRDQKQLRNLLVASLAHRFGKSFHGQALEEILDPGIATLKPTRLLFQDKLTIVKRCAACAEYRSTGCKRCEKQPSCRPRRPFYFTNDTGVFQAQVDVLQFIRCSLTRRAPGTAVTESQAIYSRVKRRGGNNKSLSTREAAAGSSSRSSGAFSPVFLTGFQEIVFLKLVSWACGSPPRPITLDIGSVQVSTCSNGDKMWRGTARNVPCPNVWKTRVCAKGTFAYHASNGAGFFISLKTISTTCLDQASCIDPVSHERKGINKKFTRDLPEELAKHFARAYQEGT